MFDNFNKSVGNKKIIKQPQQTSGAFGNFAKSVGVKSVPVKTTNNQKPVTQTKNVFGPNKPNVFGPTAPSNGVPSKPNLLNGRKLPNGNLAYDTPSGSIIEFRPDGSKAVKLAAQFDGGSFEDSPTGSLIGSAKDRQNKRDYAGLPSVQGENRDHIIPVSLGGISDSRTNIRPVQKSDNPAPFETDVAAKVKSGEMTLEQGRLAVMTHKQDMFMNTPKQGVGNNFLSGLGDTFKGIYSGTNNVIDSIKQDPWSSKDAPTSTSDIRTYGPLVITKQSKDAIINSVVDSVKKEGQSIKNYFNTVMMPSNASTGQKIAANTNLAKDSLNLAFTPITALFAGAEKVPVIGTVVKTLVGIPMAAIGDTAGYGSDTIINALPISQKTKDEIKPGLRDLSSLIAQIWVGGKTAEAIKLIKEKYTPIEAKTIIDEANKAVDEKIDPHNILNPEEKKTVLEQNKSKFSDNFEKPKPVEIPKSLPAPDGIVRGEGFTMTDKADPKIIKETRILNTAKKEFSDAIQKFNEKPTVSNRQLVEKTRTNLNTIKEGGPASHSVAAVAPLEPRISSEIASRELKVPKMANTTSDIKNLGVNDVSKETINSIENAQTGIKPGGLERAKSEIESGNMPPVKVRTLEDGTKWIEDGRHHLEAARQMGIKNYPIEDVTSAYSKPKGNVPEIKVTETPKPKTEQLKGKVFERLQKENPQLTESGSTAKVNMQEDANRAVDLVAKDKQKAYDIAMGIEKSSDITSTSTNIALAEKALEEGNAKLYSELTVKRSLDQVRRGQEINAEKGSVSNNSTARYVKELISNKLEALGDNYLDNLKGNLKKGSTKNSGIAKIDGEVAKLESKIKNKSLDTKTALSLLDKLTCL